MGLQNSEEICRFERWKNFRATWVPQQVKNINHEQIQFKMTGRKIDLNDHPSEITMKGAKLILN